MTQGTLIVLSAVASFVLSVLVNAFVAGQRWGSMRSDLETVKRDVAEIKGMFTLRLKD